MNRDLTKDTLQCTNNRTIAFISHSSKILLKVITRRILNKVEDGIAEEQGGFRASGGARNQSLKLKMVIEEKREHGKTYSSVLLTTSKPLTPWHTTSYGKICTKMGFPQHIVLLLKAMYDEQTAAVKTTYGLTEWFRIEQGVGQACII